MSETQDPSRQPDNRPSNEPQGSLPLAAGSELLIASAESRFADLAHKNFHWRSFYNGYLEGWASTAMNATRAMRLIDDMLSVFGEQDCAVTAERREAWQEERAALLRPNGADDARSGRQSNPQ